MNTGLIPTRYASALLDFANENQLQEAVYAEAKAVDKSYFQHSELRSVLDNPVLATVEKRKIICMSAGGSPSSAFERFVDLILENKREGLLHEIMLKYIDLYRKQNNIHYGKLTTATSVSVDTEKRLMSVIEKASGGILELEKVIDQEVLGGFTFEMDFVRWDASVAGQLRRIKQEYIEKNKKTV